MSLLMANDPDEILHLTKFRAHVVGTTMAALGQEYERAAQQLADRLVDLCRKFHASLSAKGLQSAEDYQQHLEKVFKAGLHAILASTGHAVALAKAIKDAAE